MFCSGLLVNIDGSYAIYLRDEPQKTAHRWSVDNRSSGIINTGLHIWFIHELSPKALYLLGLLDFGWVQGICQDTCWMGKW